MTQLTRSILANKQTHSLMSAYWSVFGCANPVNGTTFNSIDRQPETSRVLEGDGYA